MTRSEQSNLAESHVGVTLGSVASIPILHVQGDDYSRGFQRGRLIADIIARRVDELIGHSEHSMGRDALASTATRFENALRLGLPSALDELHGLSEGAGIPWRTYRLAVLGTGGGSAIQDECSVVGVTQYATSDGRTIVAKNGDLNLQTMSPDDVIIVHARPDDGYEYLEMGILPEGLRRPDGMNEAGLALVGCGQRPADGERAYSEGWSVGVPVYDMYHEIYSRCATVYDALSVLERHPRGYTGRTMIIADAQHHMVKVEISYDSMVVFHLERQRTYAQNFVMAGVSGTFSDRAMAELVTGISERPSAYVRYDRYMNLLFSSHGDLDLRKVQDILRDHEPEPGGSSICKHEDGPTLESFIFEPDSLEAWALLGHPCEHEYARVNCLVDSQECFSSGDNAVTTRGDS